MPKIKSPISASERQYNKRYELEIQKEFMKAIIKAKDENRFKPDAYTTHFMNNVTGVLAFGWELNEKQADWLAELYDKYSN